jgi:CubicO group peptidase (beta-lactamase class C family)
MDTGLLDEAAQLYRDAVARDDLKGAVLMVARRGVIVMQEAIGWRHQAYRLPMERDTIFRMASNTKPVVATAALILQEDGKLSLHDTVATHLDSFDTFRSRDITIEQLLTHASGFRIGPIFYPFDEDETPTLRGAVARFGAEGPEVEPGTSYSYSNAGYNTLGAVIEVASRMPLETFLRTRIYEPLGMVDTLNHEDPEKLSRMATVYRGRRQAGGGVEFHQGFTPGDPPDFPMTRASGGMLSTSADYARFLQMYLNRGRYADAQIISGDSVAAATRGYIASSDTTSYGLGWSVATDASYSHAGSDGTMGWVDPARELIGMVFTQSPGGRNPVREFQRLVNRAVDDGVAEQ